MTIRIAKSLITSICLYGIVVGIVLSFPHNSEGNGRMNAHETFARIGKVLSIGSVDRTLVDWYTLGPTLSEQTDHYDHVVNKSLLVLAPIYLTWFFGLLCLAGSLRGASRRTNDKI